MTRQSQNQSTSSPPPAYHNLGGLPSQICIIPRSGEQRDLVREKHVTSSCLLEEPAHTRNEVIARAGQLISYGIEDFTRAPKLAKSHVGRRRIPRHWSSAKDHDSDPVRLGVTPFFAGTASEMLDQSAT